MVRVEGRLRCLICALCGSSKLGSEAVIAIFRTILHTPLKPIHPHHSHPRATGT